MKSLGFKPLSIVHKIALAGLFTALAAILNKVLAVNYLAAVPFVRISFGGPAVIIFASILLGPLFGALVGGLSDVLGYLVFDMSAFPYAPWITLTYILLGFLAYYVFYVAKKIKNEKAMAITTYTTMGIIFVIASLLIIFSDKLQIFSAQYDLNLTLKIVLPLGMLALLAVIILSNYFFKNYFKKRTGDDELPFSIYQISFSLFILEIFVMVLFGSLMKAILFGFELFPVIVLFQAMTMFFNIPFTTFIISNIMLITKRYYRTH